MTVVLAERKQSDANARMATGRLCRVIRVHQRRLVGACARRVGRVSAMTQFLRRYWLPISFNVAWLVFSGYLISQHEFFALSTLAAPACNVSVLLTIVALW